MRELFNALCEQADDVLEKYNPCRWVDGRCAHDRIYGTRGWCCDQSIDGRYGPCDKLGPNGCTVRSLACKCWLCDVAFGISPEAFRELKEIEKVAKENGLWGFRCTFEELPHHTV